MRTKSTRLAQNKEAVKENAIDIDLLITIAEGNKAVIDRLNKIKELLLSTSPSSERSIIKLDKKIARCIKKYIKKSPKYIANGKVNKYLVKLKKLEILIVERGCRNRKEAPNDEKDFIIENGVLKKYVGHEPEVVIPNSVQVIGEKAFYGCDTLSSFEGNYGLTTIMAKAFEGCKALTSVYFPQGLTMIDDDAFYNCFALQDVIFEEGLTTIGNYAFAKCPNLYAIKLPKSVARIGEKAFFLDKGLNGRSRRKIKKINKRALK